MIDETDKSILEILRKNARMPFLEIAKKIGVSESTIRKRVGNMEENGTIKKYSAII